MGPGESTTLNITFKVLSKDNITNPIEVIFEDENRTANDTVYAIKVGIDVDKISLNRTTYLGNQSGFDIIVTNTGNVDLANVTLFENYPEELIFDSFIGDNWTQSGNEFKYCGVLRAGESVKLFVLFNTTKFGVFTNKVSVRADISNLTEIIKLIDEIIGNLSGNRTYNSSEINRLIEEIINNLSNNITANSSNITKVNVLYSEPEDPKPVEPDNSSQTVKIEEIVVKVYKFSKDIHSKDTSKHSPSNETNTKADLSVVSRPTGNPIALLILMLMMLMLPLRRKK